MLEEDEERNLTEEQRNLLAQERKARLDPILAIIRERSKRYRKETRNKFLQEDQEELRKLGAKEENMDSDGWWEYIPEDDKTRHWLTGLYIAPPVKSKVVIRQDKTDPSLQDWMKAPGVFGVVISVWTPPTITPLDNEGQPILGRDGKPVRMPGIPRVEVAFPETDYERGTTIPADCLKIRADDEDAEDLENDE
jgi:hypothetical protein